MTNKQVTKQWMDQKGFDVTTIVEDAITSLVMQGLTHQGALKLLIIQASCRMEDQAALREVLTHALNGVIDEDDEDA